MTISTKISYIAVAAVFAVALLAGTANADHAWGKYHWNLSTADTEANPLKLGDNLSGLWSAHLAATAVDWNDSVLKNVVVPGAGKAGCAPVLGQVEVCNGDYGENGWLGIAQIWTYRGKDGHIAQGITQLNDYYFNMPAYNKTAWRNLVMCQEVGHTFGLGHQDENFYNENLGSCMDYTADPEGIGSNGPENNERPNAHDYDQLTSIYAHLNDTTTGGGGGKPDKGTGGGGRGGKNKVEEVYRTPADWGQAVAQDAQGRNSVYVRNLDNGMQLITHVLWEPGVEGEHDHDAHEHAE